ncbi:Glycogen synthase kinase-3 [Hondaea fermentalgiana]|uniref:Glycogen synthase kinase-3 n=1 Tax=Hondaea fermentalgiana TaxID=2315210 RepID=A0A2R5GA06_9STRA|nr:Glycogen synthase kinase-3 [Hondaea fermentalgiana]|eukprot:GBG27862.1 Glycogen synthase kinase-3 [Hondaea fermentalgiana]
MSNSRPEEDAEEFDAEESSSLTKEDLAEFKKNITVAQLKAWGGAGEMDMISDAEDLFKNLVSTLGKEAIPKSERKQLKEAFKSNYRLASKKAVAEAAKAAAEAAKAVAEAAKTANKEKISVLISQPCIQRTIRNRNVAFSSTSRMPHVASVSQKQIDGDFLIPVDIEEWATFAADTSLAQLPFGDDILMGVDLWAPLTEFDCGDNEFTSQTNMTVSGLEQIRRYHELDPNLPDIKMYQKEGPWTGGRVDITWTRKMKESDKSKLQLLSSFHEMNAACDSIVFLVHEHKAPKAFPFVPEAGAEFKVDKETGASVSAKYGHRHRSSSQRSSQSSLSSSQSSLPPPPPLPQPDTMEDGKRVFQNLNLVGIWRRFENCDRSDYFFKFVAPICQIFTYMVSNGLKYGIISTFDKTWFCRRDKRGVMQISQAFDACTGRGIDAMRRAYLGIITLALKDPEATGYGLVKGDGTLYQAMKNHSRSTFQKFADTLASNGNEDLDSTISRKFADKFALFCKQKFNGGRQPTRQNAIDAVREVLPLSDEDFYLPLDGKTLHRNSRTIVDRCALSGAPIIVKRWAYSLLPRRPDENDEAKLAMQNERWAYEVTLGSLQGIAIPFLIYAGSYAMMPFVLAVSDEGDSLEQLLMAAADDDERATLLETYFDDAHDALAAIHSCGVLHNDIAARNIVIHPERGVKIIDFESAGECCEDLLAQEEMRELFKIFNRTVTGTPKKTGKKVWRRLSQTLPIPFNNARESKPPMEET